jgi:Protein of unknown function (DUF3307)
MMPNELIATLALIAGFQVKHFICDGLLQTRAMVRDKAVYAKPHGVLHAAIHGFGAFLVVVLFGYQFWAALALALVDSVFHYHVDYVKENLVRRAGWTSLNHQFWWSISADQMVHQLSYLAFVFYLLTP